MSKDCNVYDLEHSMTRKKRLWYKKSYKRGLTYIKKVRKITGKKIFLINEASLKARINVINRTNKKRRKLKQSYPTEKSKNVL